MTQSWRWAGPGELSIQQTENRWGGEPGFSLQGFISFYFIFLMSDWLCFPALVVLSLRLDLIWLVFSFALHASSLFSSCLFLLFSPFTNSCFLPPPFLPSHLTFLPFLSPLLNYVLFSPPSSFLIYLISFFLLISPLSLFFFMRLPFLFHLSSHLPSSMSFLSGLIFPSHPSFATPTLIPPSLSPHPLSTLPHPLHPLRTAHEMTG